MDRNDLRETALSDLADDRIAETFLRAEFPTEVLGDLRALIEEVHTPLAVRSSSLLEDALFQPGHDLVGVGIGGFVDVGGDGDRSTAVGTADG